MNYPAWKSGRKLSSKLSSSWLRKSMYEGFLDERLWHADPQSNTVIPCKSFRQVILCTQASTFFVTASYLTLGSRLSLYLRLGRHIIGFVAWFISARLPSKSRRSIVYFRLLAPVTSIRYVITGTLRFRAKCLKNTVHATQNIAIQAWQWLPPEPKFLDKPPKQACDQQNIVYKHSIDAFHLLYVVLSIYSWICMC